MVRNPAFTALPWPCFRCNRTFTHARFLARHMTFFHLAEEPGWQDPPDEYQEDPDRVGDLYSWDKPL